MIDSNRCGVQQIEDEWLKSQFLAPIAQQNKGSGTRSRQTGKCESKFPNPRGAYHLPGHSPRRRIIKSWNSGGADKIQRYSRKILQIIPNCVRRKKVSLRAIVRWVATHTYIGWYAYITEPCAKSDYQSLTTEPKAHQPLKKISIESVAIFSCPVIYWTPST